MHDADQGVKIVMESCLRQPHEIERSVGPDRLVGCDIDFPTSDASHQLCIHQPTLGLCQLQHAFGLLHLHLLHLGDVRKYHQGTHHHALAVKPDLIEYGTKAAADETALRVIDVA